jgi:hypothetical protein
MSYTGSMAGAFRSRHERATQAALTAGAQVVVNGLKDEKPLGLRAGYTSGAFVTGNILNSIYTTDPQQDGGGWHVLVATDVMYAVYWEYGHVNLFTRRYEREERWEPTLRRTRDEVVKAYQRVYARFMT